MRISEACLYQSYCLRETWWDPCPVMIWCWPVCNLSSSCSCCCVVTSDSLAEQLQDKDCMTPSSLSSCFLLCQFLSCTTSYPSCCLLLTAAAVVVAAVTGSCCWCCSLLPTTTPAQHQLISGHLSKKPQTGRRHSWLYYKTHLPLFELYMMIMMMHTLQSTAFIVNILLNCYKTVYSL